MLLSFLPNRVPQKKRADRRDVGRNGLAFKFRDVADDGGVVRLPPFKDLDQGRRQRHAVFLASLHPVGRSGPDAAHQVNLTPFGTNHLSGAGGCEDGELKGSRRCPWLPLQSRHEGAHLCVGQGGMVLDLMGTRLRRWQLLKVSLPAGRVLAFAQSSGLGPIKHRLDASSHPAGGLGLDRPDRLQDGQHQSGVDVRDAPTSEDRIGIGRRGAFPLLGMLFVAPASLVRADVGGGRLLERKALGGVQRGANACELSLLDRIDAVELEASGVPRHRPRFRQADRMNRAQPHLPGTALEHVAIDPRFAATCLDVQVEASAIGGHPRSRRSFHLQRRQAFPKSGHFVPHFVPQTRRGAWWIALDVPRHDFAISPYAAGIYRTPLDVFGPIRMG